MRDPRLRSEWATAQAEERRAATTRLLEMEETADRREIDRILSTWWTEVLAQDSKGEEWDALHVDNLRERCSSLSPGSRSLALTAPDTLAGNATGVSTGVGALLLGESAAEAIRSGSSAVPLDRAVSFLSECWDAVDVLTDALRRAPCWPESLEILARPHPTISNLLGHHFGRLPPDDILIKEERTSRERGLLSYFWGRQFDGITLNEPTLVRLTILAARNWHTLADQAEALPLREFRTYLWQHLHLTEDRDAILSLLESAELVFDAGRWTGRTTALAALGAAIDHADQLYTRLTRSHPPPPDPDGKLKSLIEHDLPSWLTQVARAALARRDGRLLLLILAAHLIGKDLRTHTNGTRSWSCTRHALWAINHVLVQKPSTAELRCVADVSSVPNPPSNIDQTTYLLTAAVFDAPAREVWDWYRKLLLQGDSGLCGLARSWPRGLCYEPLAERLGHLSNPFDEWRSAWKVLFVTDRERARFATHDADGLYPSLHLVRTGAELLRQSPQRTGASHFLEELFAHTQQLMTTYRNLVSTLAPTLAIDAIDVAPRVLGAGWPRALESHRALLSSAKLRLYVAALLVEGGASYGDIETAIEIAPHTLADTVTELKQFTGPDLEVRRLCKIVATAGEEHADRSRRGTS